MVCWFWPMIWTEIMLNMMARAEEQLPLPLPEPPQPPKKQKRRGK